MKTEENSAITTLLNPLNPEQFFTEYWEKTPLHLERASDTHFADILSIEAVDAVLASTELYFPDVQLIKQPDGIAHESYTGEHNRILPLRLLEHHALGATLTIASAQARVRALGDFCRALQSDLQMRTRANIYLSPPGQQGFKPHYDTHDVFILQVSGKKQFNFYANNIELPFNEDEFDGQNFEPGKLTEAITLTAGDTLYIPRGVTHDAIALDHTPSLHITLGVYPIIMRDLLQELLQLAAEQDARLRQSITPSQWSGNASAPVSVRPGSGNQLASGDQPASSRQELATLMRDLVDQVVSESNVDAALARFQDQLAMESTQDSSGLLSTPMHSLTVLSTVSVKRHMVMSVSRTSDATVVRSPGQILEFSQQMGTALLWLIDQGTATVSDLPLSDDEQKLALINRLYQENIVKIE